MELERKLSFYDMFDGEFLEYIYSAQLVLAKKNPEYKKIINDIEEILKKNSNISNLIDNGEQVSISYEESALLLKLLDLYESKRIIEAKEYFFKGMREGFFLIDRMNLIKSSVDDE